MFSILNVMERSYSNGIVKFMFEKWLPDVEAESRSGCP